MNQVTIRGRRWRLVFEPLDGIEAGNCDPPDALNKAIRVDTDLDADETLRVLIHEMLHAALWDLAEEAIDETSTDVADALWQLGYRCAKDQA